MSPKHQLHNNMNSLDEIAKKYNTDKSSLGHNYANLYEAVLNQLKNDNISLLEIGVRQGFLPKTS